MHTARAGIHGAALALCLVTLAACQQSPQAGPLGQVAWVSGDSLWARALPEGKPRLLGAGRGLRRPLFSPSGRWLAVLLGDGLRLARTDGSGGQRLARSGATHFAWAPTDDRLAYIAGGNLMVTRAGSIGALLVDRTGGPATTSVAWSPDGRWLAFGIWPPSAAAGRAPGAVQPDEGSRYALWRMPARGGSPSPLPLPAVPLAAPPLVRGWTANGTRVLVMLPSGPAPAGESAAPAALADTGLYSIPATAAPGAPGPIRVADSALAQAGAAPPSEEGQVVLARTPDGRVLLLSEYMGTASLWLTAQGAERGKLVVRLRPPGPPGAGRPDWRKLVAYSPR